MSGGSRIGFYGKLPSRGDFVRIGLSREVAAAWDDWVQSVLPPARQSLGSHWLEAWQGGPAWRFALAAGLCGPRPVTGLWLPSADAVGRAFPLLVAVEAAVAPACLAALEPVVADSIRHAAEPDALAVRLSKAFRSEPAPLGAVDCALWWTRTPGGSSRMFSVSSMPDPDRFLCMLRTGSPL